MPSAPISAERQRLVQQAVAEWKRRLVDLSRRNNLLYFRDLKRGTFDLTPFASLVRTTLLVGTALTTADLMASGLRQEGVVNFRELARRALANREEKGLDTLHLAIGFATWEATDGGKPPNAPVVLLPITVESKGVRGAQWTIVPAGELRVNPVLAYALREVGVVIDDAMVDPLNSDDAASDDVIAQACAYLERVAGRVPGFSISDGMKLGNFAYQQLAMVNDLSSVTPILSEHELIAALAGDVEARQAVLNARTIEPVETLDHVPPDREFLVVDADSSQQQVIRTVLAKQSGLIQGPPGTGKSQTIVNLIGACAAAGWRVLFVAEKRAALDVVFRRLDEIGLGHLVLDLHGADISRKQVMDQITRSLEILREADVPDTSQVHQRFEQLRSQLNQHVVDVHSLLPPAGKSVFQLEAELLALPGEAQSQTRWGGDALNQLDTQAAQTIRDALQQAGAFPDLFLGVDASPWNACQAIDGAQVSETLAAARDLTLTLLPAFTDALVALCQPELSRPRTLAEANDLIALCSRTVAIYDRYQPEIFTEDLAALAVSLAPAKGAFSHLAAKLFNSSFRASRRKVASLLVDSQRSDHQLLEDVNHCNEIVGEWGRAGSSSVPTLSQEVVEAARKSYDAVCEMLPAVAGPLMWQNTTSIDLATLQTRLAAVHADAAKARALPFIQLLRSRIEAAGGGGIVAELRSRRPAPQLWGQIFEHAWYASCLDRRLAESPELAGFNGRVQDAKTREFAALDRKRIDLARTRVLRTHAERAFHTRNQHLDQDSIVRRQAQKQRRIMPIRRLVAAAPDVLTALRPCWVLSPLSVSQLLPNDRRLFDLVIFDEASQVLPEAAIPSLMRADRAVVAGDTRQLPPTTFFADGGNDGSDSSADDLSTGAISGFDSILDQMSGFLDPWWLRWHYRSRDEALIAFSNQHIYDRQLVTLPSVGGDKPLTHILVEQDGARTGDEESSSGEVQRVVEQIIAHAESRPNESLGVIAMGIKHADRLQAALDQALSLRRDLDDFFDTTRDERFFIKNLERVQGDERDAIILSVGYSKDPSGRLPYRFGPLLSEGGERRLNVAITRARRRMTVVSSFDHRDMDPSRSSARGVELLRLYLQYAASAGRNLGETQATATVPMNGFEHDIKVALEGQGLSLLPQWGVSKYRLDFAVQHPRRPGEFVLAIECDGATYHSSPTARDRDRLRQQQLEALGWRFHRIWSTDWFNDRIGEIKRAVTAYEQAVDSAEEPRPQSDPVVQNKQFEPAEPEDQADRLPAPAERRMGSRPNLPMRRPIDEYSPVQLDALIRWLLSDRRLRTDEQLIAEAMQELGFRRRGHRIEQALTYAIRRVRASG